MLAVTLAGSPPIGFTATSRATTSAVTVFCKLSLRCIRLALSPIIGSFIVQAMHEAMCEHQHPLSFEFERAAVFQEFQDERSALESFPGNAAQNNA